jgi:hypothetical protein
MKLFNAFMFIVPLVILSFTPGQQTPEKTTAVAGTKISLKPPAGFTPASQYPGFELQDLGSSIMITEIPGPFKEVSAGVTDPAALKKQGISVLSSQQIKIAGHTGVLVRVAQNAFDTDYLKWLLVFGDEKETVMIAATFPKQFASKLSEIMKTSIFTATWDRGKEVSPTEDLNFTVSEKGDMKLAKRVSNLLIFTRSGSVPKKDIDDSYFIVGPGVNKIETDNPEGFARSYILENDSVTGIEIEQSNKMTIDSLNGYEIVARGKDKKSGQPMVIYQTVLFVGQDFYFMIGVSSDRQREAYLTIFREMAGSFKRK